MTWEQEQMEAEARGRKEGRKEGKHEALLATARKMLAKNMDVNTIMEITGLKLEEIETLKKE